MDAITSNNKNNNMREEVKVVPSFSIVATIAGRLVHQRASNSNTDTYYISSNTQRYIPTLGDRVIGIVEDATGDYYRVISI